MKQVKELLHQNSEVYQREIIQMKGEFIELHLENTRSAAPGDKKKFHEIQLSYFLSMYLVTHCIGTFLVKKTVMP